MHRELAMPLAAQVWIQNSYLIWVVSEYAWQHWLFQLIQLASCVALILARERER